MVYASFGKGLRSEIAGNKEQDKHHKYVDVDHGITHNSVF
jgi:hypothetical protein